MSVPANISFILGGVDLSQYVRVNPGEGFDPADGTMLDPAFSDSPLFEGQYLTSVHAKNKEIKIPLFLHPSTAPYLQDALNQVVQQVNNALRPVIDLGQPIDVQWTNAQASNPTHFTVQFGRFEPAFNFRQTEHGYLGGILHLWVLPYGHTGLNRVIGTWPAPTWQNGMFLTSASIVAAGGTIVGDVSPWLDIRVTTGSAIGSGERVGIISALPVPSYQPIFTPSQMSILNSIGAIGGASGAWGSSILRLNPASAGLAPYQNSQFSFFLSPGSVYSGDNRVLGLVRARYEPMSLRAFDPLGNPIGPTVMASALDGWQLVDYGTLRISDWMSFPQMSVSAYSAEMVNASGMFAPRRCTPTWALEHGPVFVLPQDSTIIDMDFNSPPLAIDGFDGTGTINGTSPIGPDQLGNMWQAAGPNNIFHGGLVAGYDGNSGLAIGSCLGIALYYSSGSIVAAQQTNYEVAAVVQPLGAATKGIVRVGLWNPSSGEVSGLSWFMASGMSMPFSSLMAVKVIPSGVYDLKMTTFGATVVAEIGGPSGAFSGSENGQTLKFSCSNLGVGTAGYPFFSIQTFGGDAGLTSSGTIVIQSFRARLIASTGVTGQDILHLDQSIPRNTRSDVNRQDKVDLSARQRGPMQAPFLPTPSMGAGLFLAAFPWDQGPANDLLNVDLRVRERFTYAR